MSLDRRTHPRTEVLRTLCMRITDEGCSDEGRSQPSQYVVARLRDFSSGGFGVLTARPLAVGSIVVLNYELDDCGFHMELSGRAKVAYCSSGEDGLFRMGLAHEGLLWGVRGEGGVGAAFQFMLQELHCAPLDRSEYFLERSGQSEYAEAADQAPQYPHPTM